MKTIWTCNTPQESEVILTTTMTFQALEEVIDSISDNSSENSSTYRQELINARDSILDGHHGATE